MIWWKAWLAMLAAGKTVRPTVGLVFTSLLLAAGCSNVGWDYNLDTGLAKAAQRKCPVLVEFYSGLNADCMEMDQQVFSDPGVQQKLKGYVPVRLDYSLHSSLAKQLGVAVLPTFFILRYDQTVAGSQAGKLDANKFGFFLVKYRYY